eukprot:6291862-Amphidinium_carterae.1
MPKSRKGNLERGVLWSVVPGARGRMLQPKHPEIEINVHFVHIIVAAIMSTTSSTIGGGCGCYNAVS